MKKRALTFALIAGTYVALPFLLLRILLRSKTKNEHPRFLVIPQLTRIGDVICSTPVFSALRKAYPRSHISVLVSVMTAPLLESNPNINEVIIFENYTFGQLVAKLLREKFDWSFSLSGTSYSTLLTLWGGISKRIKIVRKNRPLSEILTDWFSTDTVSYNNHEYLPQKYLDFVRLTGAEVIDEKKQVFITSETEKKAERFFDSLNIKIGTEAMAPLVGISITAGNAIKEWGDKKFLELALLIQKKYQAKILFIGSPRDKERISAIVKSAKETHQESFFEATDFNLKELPALIKNLGFFISGDTGPMHMAHALGVPLIDIIGPVHPDEQAPRDAKSLLVFPSPAVAPTIFAFEKAGPTELTRKALDQTSVGDVINAFSLTYDTDLASRSSMR